MSCHHRSADIEKSCHTLPFYYHSHWSIFSCLAIVSYRVFQDPKINPSSQLATKHLLKLECSSNKIAQIDTIHVVHQHATSIVNWHIQLLQSCKSLNHLSHSLGNLYRSQPPIHPKFSATSIRGKCWRPPIPNGAIQGSDRSWKMGSVPAAHHFCDHGDPRAHLPAPIHGNGIFTYMYGHGWISMANVGRFLPVPWILWAMDPSWQISPFPKPTSWEMSYCLWQDTKQFTPEMI